MFKGNIRHRGRCRSIWCFAGNLATKFKALCNLLFCSDCEHVRLLWPKHGQLLDVRRKCQVRRWLLQDKVLKEEAGDALEVMN